MTIRIENYLRKNINLNTQKLSVVKKTGFVFVVRDKLRNCSELFYVVLHRNLEFCKSYKLFEIITHPSTPLEILLYLQGCIQKFQDSTCKKKFAYLGY